MFKVYAIQAEGEFDDGIIPVMVGTPTRYYDDAVAIAEAAFEYCKWADTVEVFAPDKFGPIARVSDSGIHDLTGDTMNPEHQDHRETVQDLHDELHAMAWDPQASKGGKYTYTGEITLQRKQQYAADAFSDVLSGL